MLAQHWHHQTMGQIAKSILDEAPETFALAGTSMGGYVAFEIMRQAPERVEKLILMSTSAKPDAPERSADRLKQVAAAREHGMRRGTLATYPLLVHPARHEDIALRNMFIDMAEVLGADAFGRQIAAIIGRADSRPTLVGDQGSNAGYRRGRRQTHHAGQLRRDRQRHQGRVAEDGR